jgi:Tol biopolymer transport system component
LPTTRLRRWSTLLEPCGARARDQKGPVPDLESYPMARSRYRHHPRQQAVTNPNVQTARRRARENQPKRSLVLPCADRYNPAVPAHLAITRGTRLGVYEVITLLGSGGMGEVYQAKDTRLKRDVALKVLPDTFAQDTDRLARFQREAELLATLNHPNIAGIYGLEESDGVRALVLELVEGPTLADRIAKGPIPIDEALPIARQIADALEAAHEKGVVHRDLKPANVKVTPDGKVKVLDFGLAKMLESTISPGVAAVTTNSPTITTPAMTQMGVILGTAAYMSPEQAKGRPVDRRTDIFAFGCVLYEMLRGHRAFDGEDVTEILGRVVTAEPEWERLPARTPPSIRRLLRRALNKDPRHRLGDMRDARIELEEGETESEPMISSGATRGMRMAWVVATAAGVVAAVVAVPAVRHLYETPRPFPPEMRLQIMTPSTAVPFEFALSPDGRQIVFVAFDDGPQRLWLRPLDKTDAQPVAGTEGAEYPFWSADSRSIGFFALGKLYRVDIGGGFPQALANASPGRGGTWNADGTILFAPGTQRPLLRIAASGGEASAITRLNPPHQTGHRFPQFLPDGRHFLFYAVGGPQESGIYLGSLDGGEPKRLTGADSAGAYLEPGHVVFVRQGSLVARRLNLAQGELMGDSVTIADQVGHDNFALGAFSVVSNGRLAYRSGGASRQQLKWFDRTGKAVGAVSEPDANNLLYPELSPDGRRVAVQRTIQNNADIWLLDLVRGGFTRFTSDNAADNLPLWSPDGTRIVFQSSRNGTFNLYVKPTSGTGTEEVLLETTNNKAPQDWSKDGRFILYYELDSQTDQRDLWAVDVTTKERKPRAVVKTPFEERNGQFSPDGRWVAYETNESGRFEIVVQPFPEPSGKWQVSTSGGIAPRWRVDGKELYFIAPDSKLMAVVVTALGATFEAGAPVVLLSTRILGGGSGSFAKHQYAVSRDGHFLINQVEDSITTPITLIINLKL